MAKFNTGQSFADGDTVTGAKLNNITSQLNIYTGVISEQAAMSATVSTVDQLLIADTDNGDSGAANKITVQKLFDDSLTNGTYTAANLSGTITANRTVATSATITTGTIPTLVSNNATIGTTNGTLGNFTSAAITSGTITTALIPTLTAGTTTGTAGIFTSGTIATLNSTTGTIATLNSTTGTIGNLSTTLAGDFTISSGTGTLGTTAVTAGSYGSVSAIPFITVDAKGRVTAATTGTFSLTPPAGSVTLNTLSTSTTESDNVAKRTAKAWVNFNGTGTVAIQASLNVSSITDNGGVGNYTVNFTDPMVDAKYAASIDGDFQFGFSSLTTSSAITIRTVQKNVGLTDSPNYQDFSFVCVIIFR
jgi:hypothetical protein